MFPYDNISASKNTSTKKYKKKILSSICLVPVALIMTPQLAHAQLVNTATVSGTPDAGTLPATTATESVTLTTPIDSADDSATGINGTTGATGVLNVFDNDTLDGAAVNPADVTLTETVADPTGALTLNPDGTVDVAPGTPAGTYQLTYEICETLNPTNCTTSTVTVEVEEPLIEATDDSATGINGTTGATGVVNAFDNDELNGVAVDPADITATVTTPATPLVPGAPVPVMNPLTGEVDVPAGTPAGTYTIEYEICETLNPTNCTTATVTVDVEAPEIDSVDDSATGINGTTGATGVVNAFANDTLNGAPVNPADITGSITTPATPLVPGAPVPVMDPVTGLVDVPAGTPAGTYTIEYEICETLNPTNCTTSVVTIEVEEPPIDSVDDSATGINGTTGATGVLNVFGNDTLNGAPVNPADVTLTETVADPTGALTLNPDGSVDVAPGTPAGTYQLTYEICETLNPTNCTTSVVTVDVEAPEIDSVDDSATGINGTTGATGVVNAFANDTLNGAPVNPADITGSITTPATPLVPGAPVPVMDPVTGLVDVPAGTPAGTYTIEYEICETLNPTNCTTSVVTIEVEEPPIDSVDDSATGINGTTGATGVLNVFGNDTLNGAPVNPADVTLTETVADPTGALTLNPDGSVDVAPGTPAGTYQLTYEICETLNPTNCTTSVVTVDVEAPEIDSVDDSATGINGTTGATGVVNAFANDTLNGAPVNPADITGSITTPATPLVPGAPVPVMDPVTGLVDVPAGTPAGTYTIEYEICETLNPTNCTTSVVTIEVEEPPIDSVDDSATGINGTTGATGVLNVFGNDTLNGAPVNPADVTLTETVADPTGALTLNPDGSVDVAPGTPAGTYQLTYEICETLNPTNCTTSVVTVDVEAPEIDSVDDSATGINGTTGATGVVNAFANDTLNGAPVNPADITGSITTPATPLVPGAPVPVMDPVTGLVDVPAGTPAGTYTIEYEICETLNPTNCTTSVVTIEVEEPPIDSVDDSATGINGTTGATGVLNVFGNDTLNGAPVNPADVTLTETVADPTGALTLNPDGSVDVAPGTPAGTYQLTYEICETLNPTNCTTSVVTVDVEAPEIDSVDDSATGINGTTGATGVVNAFANDTLNGAPVNPADITGSITTPATPLVPGAPVPVMDPVTGLVDVPAGTPAGTYTIEYEICETLNPTNCTTSVVTIEVEEPPIDSVDDSATGINGTTGATGVLNVFGNDTLNGAPVNPADVTLTETVADPTGALTLNPDGSVDVAPGTPAGTYQLTYEICETLNPTNCTTSVVTVDVEAPEIDAIPEVFAPIDSAAGGVTGSVLLSDTLNGVAVDPNDVTLTVGASDPELTLDPATGFITVAPGTPAGTYTVEYTICEDLNPTNCATVVETVVVEEGPIDALPEAFPPVNGTDGGVTTSVLASDVLNGAPVDPADVTITVGASDPELTLDPATGLITVAPGTPAGTYTVEYTICEDLNPTNCATVTEEVVVEEAPIDAIPEVFAPIDSAAGGVTGSVLLSDTLNGVAVDPNDVTLTVGASDPELTLDPATGFITVAPGTPAGTYTVEYTICEDLNPTNCATVVETVVVEEGPIDALPEAFPPVNGTDGGVTTSVLASDVLNGAPVDPADVTITVGASDPELTLDPATGLITVAPGTPAGTYTVEYTICEDLNPTNCATVTEEVVVEEAPIDAIPEVFAPIDSAAGGVTGSVLLSDTLNGVAVDPNDVTLTVGASDPELTLDPATGFITVAPGTPAGTYTVEYTICEDLNPTNCATVVETVVVEEGPIDALPEAFPPVNGTDGGVTTSVLASDVLNGAPVDPADVTITVGASDPELTLDPATGLITVAPGTPAGTYTVEYTICEDLNPTNCATVTEEVVVEEAPIDAIPEVFAPIDSAAGGVTGSVLLSDTLNGVAVDPNDVTLTVGASDPELTLDPATGFITVAPGTPAGTYTVEYTICEDLNPTNCATVVETVVVEEGPIDALPEAFPPVNGTDGGVTTSVLASDVLNGAPVDPADVTITVGASDPELTLDPATGLITVAPGTPAGTYTVEYTICEDLNPTNCATVTEEVVVEEAPIDAIPEVFAPIDSAAGGVTGSVLLSDTLNGVAVDPNDVTLTVGASDPELTLDPATGFITVAPGTPAGTYTVEYTICEDLNPTNCATVVETVVVEEGPIDALPEAFPPVNGTDGGVTTSVLASDVLNGAPVDPADVTITVGASDPELTLDPATGLITVAPGTPAGTYTVEYTICEDLNPTNCATVTEEVVVEEAPIDAIPEVFAPIDSAAGGVTGSVLLSDTLNGVAVDPNDVTLTVGASDPELTLDPATGFITVAPGTPAGTYTVEYTICEDLNPTNCATVVETVVVEETLATLSGVVYFDTNSNNTPDSNETVFDGWTVEIKDDKGDVIASVVTDENGYYEVDLPFGDFTVCFINPETGEVYSETEIQLNANTKLPSGEIAAVINLPIDPSGVVYDAVTRDPVPGTVLTFVDSNGQALPPICFIDPSQQNQTTGANGAYRFDIVPGADAACPVGQTDYSIIFDAPASHLDTNSTIIGAQPGFLITNAGTGPLEVAPTTDAPQIGEDTTHYFGFTLGQGSRDVVNNHIPLDPITLVRSPLDVVKSTPRQDVSFGDLVPYTITVTNTEDLPRVGLDLVDFTPPGFKYVEDTSFLDDVEVDPTVSGREIVLSDFDFAPNETKTWNLVLVVGAGVGDGVYTNQAYIRDENDAEISNRGEAVVRISPDPIFDCSEIIGKVFDDKNKDGYQDEGEPGMAGVRLATAKGLLVTTDQHGRYHIACAAIPNERIGSNFILKVDDRTLPTGYGFTSENPRVVRLTRGKTTKANFAVALENFIDLEVTDAAFEPGTATLRPEFAAQLGQIVEALEAQEASLRLTYFATAVGNEGRIDALSDQIQELWDVYGGDYDLNIERKTIWSGGGSASQPGWEE